MTGMRRLLPTPEEPTAEIDVSTAYRLPEEPHLRAVFVESMDGAATAGTGRSGGLSGETDRRLLLQLRELTDAVLVGAATVRAEGYGSVGLSDEAQQRRRDAGLTARPPICIVSASAQFDPGAKVFVDAHELPIVLTSEAAAAENGKQLAGLAEIVTAGETAVDLRLVMERLRDRGLLRVQCEGGPSLFGRLIDADLVDELCLTLSPSLVGGDLPRIVAALPPADPPRRIRLTDLFVDDESFLFARYALR
jgi:riboflavin-specific deaminase-like protein